MGTTHPSLGERSTPLVGTGTRVGEKSPTVSRPCAVGDPQTRTAPELAEWSVLRECLLYLQPSGTVEKIIQFGRLVKEVPQRAALRTFKGLCP